MYIEISPESKDSAKLVIKVYHLQKVSKVLFRNFVSGGMCSIWLFVEETAFFLFSFFPAFVGFYTIVSFLLTSHQCKLFSDFLRKNEIPDGGAKMWDLMTLREYSSNLGKIYWKKWKRHKVRAWRWRHSPLKNFFGGPNWCP